MLARRSLLFALSGALTVLAAAGATEADWSPPLQLTLRSRVPAAKGRGAFEVVSKRASWNPRQTAVIVCDMWDTHHCLSAALRVTELAPRMNAVLDKARA